MWDWLISRRRTSRRRQETAAENNHAQNRNDNDPNANWPFCTNFFQSSAASAFDRLNQCRITNHDFENRPKCLQTFSCTDILHGQRLEDFSRDCWLENHLHRFGSPDVHERLVFDYSIPEIPETETLNFSDDSATGSDDSLEMMSGTLTGRQGQRRHALEELFMPLEQTGSGDVELVFDRPNDELPPYSQYPDDPPPTYEEAVGQQVDRRSLRSHHSSELAFIW